jgi:hypothetical protein
VLGLEKTLRSHLLETMKEKNEFLFFVLRNASDNSFKLLSFADYLTHFKENPEKNELFLIFIDSYNQANGTNALIKMIFSGLSKFLPLEKALNFNFILIKDFFYYNPDKCLDFKNSIYWRVSYQVNFYLNFSL